MKQVHHARPGPYPGGAAGYANPLNSTRGAGFWSTGENVVRVTCPVDTTFRNLVVEVTVAPGSGKSHTFTFRVAGAGTALTVTIADGATSASLSGVDVAVTGGQDIAIEWTSLNSPAAAEPTISIESDTDSANQSIYAQATAPTSGTSYNGPFRGNSNWTGTEGHGSRDVVPIPGTLVGMRYRIRDAPGGGNSEIYALVLNGVVQDGSGGTVDTRATVSGGSTTASATFSLPLVVGDVVSLQGVLNYAQGGSGICYSALFEADTDGWSIYCGRGSGTLMENAAVAYAEPPTTEERVWDTTEANVEAIAGLTPFVLFGLIVSVNASPGSGKSYTVDGRVDGATPTGAPSVSITHTSGLIVSDPTGTMTVTPGQRFALRSTPSGTPTAIEAVWAFGMLFPAQVVRVTQLVNLIVQDRPPDPAVLTPPTGGGAVGAGTNPAGGVNLCDEPTLLVYMDLTPAGGSTRRYTKDPLNVTVADDARVKSFGRIVRALTNRRGGDLRGSTVTVTLVDTDRYLRGLEASDGFTNALLEIYITTEAAYRAGSTPRRVFSGLVTDSEPLPELAFRLQASGYLQSLLEIRPEPTYPQRVFSVADFPNMANHPLDLVSPGNPEMIGKPVPVGYGNLSDEHLGLAAVGVVPGIYTGIRYIPFFAQDWSEFVLFGHASAGAPFSLFAPITPFPTISTAPARIKYDPTTLPVATDWLTPWHAEWNLAFGSTAPYRDFNGNRYCVIYGRGPSAELARTGQVPVVVNLAGVEDDGDGSGTLIDSLPLQILHFLINFVLQTYTSGSWLASPVVNGYSRTNAGSFQAAKAQSEERIPGGHLGAWLAAWDQQGITLNELARLAYEHGIYLGENKDGQIIGSMIDPGAAPVRTVVDVTDTLRRSFRARTRRDEIANSFTYRYGRLYTPPLPQPTPTTGSALPASLVQPALEWEVDNQVTVDAASVAKYGTRKMNSDDGLSLELTRDAATADDLALLHKEVLAPGPLVAAYREGPCGTNVDLGDNVALTHFEGVDTGGWTARTLRCEQHTLDLDAPEAFSVEVEGLDVEELPAS